MSTTLEVLELTKTLKVVEIDKRIEELSRELDLLRLLKQIADVQAMQRISDVHKDHQVFDDPPESPLALEPPPPSLVGFQSGTIASRCSRLSDLPEEVEDETESLGRFYVPSNGQASIQQNKPPQAKRLSKGSTGPAPWSIAGQIHALLLAEGPMALRDIVDRMGGKRNGVEAALDYWKNRLFEKVDRGLWKALPFDPNLVKQKPARGEYQPPKREYKKHDAPGADTVAGRIYAFLLERGPTKLIEIVRAFGDVEEKNVRSSIRFWKGRVFEQVSHGIWKAIPLDKSLPENTRTPFIPAILEDKETDAIQPYPDPFQDEDDYEEEDQAEQETEEPLNGDSFRIRAYLQRNQPAKPMIIAADLNIPIGQVTVLLSKYKCFTMNGNGWVLKKTRQTN